MDRIQSKSVVALLVVASAIGIAAVDILTRDEIRIFPLYFLPLMLVAWRFGKAAAISASLAMTALWVFGLYLGGRTYSSPGVWAINIVAQAITFLIVSLLVAMLHEAMLRERALSRIDPLTGLPNRRSFLEEATGVLSSCERHGRPVTLAYLDLDNFKHANDELGHHHGDAVLRRVADVFSHSLRASDVTARIGGDEFVVLLPETTEEMAGKALEKVRTTLNQDPLLKRAGVTVSIGAINRAPANGDLSDMMRAADEVLYRVKSSTKNRVQLEGVRVG